jgi:hypothetical protein
MGRPTRYSPEVRERAISAWAALQAVATKLGTTAETLCSPSTRLSRLWAPRKARRPVRGHAQTRVTSPRSAPLVLDPERPACRRIAVP